MNPLLAVLALASVVFILPDDAPPKKRSENTEKPPAKRPAKKATKSKTKTVKIEEEEESDDE